MKRILFILSFLAFSVVGMAQDNLTSPVYGNVLDTVTNTGTKYMVAAVKNAPSVIGIQVTIRKISGTGAGTAILQSSNDGVNYFTVPVADTFTLTNVTTQCFGWKVVDPAFAYYRINVTGSGTESIEIKGKILGRKP